VEVVAGMRLCAARSWWEEEHTAEAKIAGPEESVEVVVVDNNFPAEEMFVAVVEEGTVVVPE
jgi:hypothetical protein